MLTEQIGGYYDASKCAQWLAYIGKSSYRYFWLTGCAPQSNTLDTCWVYACCDTQSRTDQSHLLPPNHVSGVHKTSCWRADRPTRHSVHQGPNPSANAELCTLKRLPEIPTVLANHPCRDLVLYPAQASRLFCHLIQPLGHLHC